MTQTMESGESSTASAENKRRSTRLIHAVGLTVQGTDALGKPFREVTKTSVVSCYGCAFRLRGYAPKNSEIALEVSRGHSWLAPRRVTARVIWVQRPQNLREQYQIAVALDVPGNVWGVEAPPEDWFPHPEDVVRTPPPPAEEEKPPESQTPEAPPVVEAMEMAAVPETSPDAEPEAEVTVIPAPAEEVVFTRGQLDVKIEEALGTTLRSMMGREAEEAVRGFARETAERAMAVIAEVRKTNEALAEELDARIRQVLDEAVNGPGELPPPPTEPPPTPEKMSRRKRWRRERQRY